MNLYLTTPGVSLHRRGDLLLVRRGPAVLSRVRVNDLQQVVAFGNVSLSADVIRLFLTQGIDTVFLSRGGDYRGRLVGKPHRNVLLRQMQFRRFEDDAFRLATARAFVTGKLRNMRTLAMRLARRRGLDVSPAAHRLRHLVQQVAEADRADVIRGLEGSGTAAYFGVFGAFLSPEFGFAGRNRRPPRDPANAMLSFGYALLASAVEGTLHLVGLDPYLGYLHLVDYGRPSLALDVMEEFRPVLVDALVLDLGNHRTITPDDFTSRAGGVYLGDTGRRCLIDHFERRMASTVMYPVSNERVERVTYRACLENQARRLARVILGEEPVYQSFLIR
jgi:CRISPR-associated protein Cas1